ncbi:MAG: gamma-glutamyltransferase family protein [Opitutales bacterium]|nr:gamma-glutamyltransferase family protein [Opitutales bacterium]
MCPLKRICRTFFFIALAATPAGFHAAPGANGPAAALPEQPEGATGFTAKPGWATASFSVAAANPRATAAGYGIIRAGGSAIDAAIAVQLVLSLVEPQSSGIGGGAFLLYWDGERVHAYNGRETAPAAADANLFLDESGEPLPFSRAVRSGLSVGVPGTLALLKAVHGEHGVLPWEQVLAPAIELAESGVEMSPRLHRLLERENALRRDPVAGAHYYDANGRPHPVGYRLQNPAYATILRKVAKEGIAAFYEGPVAEDIVRRVAAHERPGKLTLADLAAYPARELRTEPLSHVWQGYRIYGFPPPSSGHLTILQILRLLDQQPPVAEPLVDGLPTSAWLHFFFEASRLAFADRNHYIADPRFVDPPAGDWETLLDAAYLAERAALITGRSMGTALPGQPRARASSHGSPEPQPEGGTSHISIVDREGRAVSMTTTIESGFGSRIMSDGGTGLAGGFLLNNQLTDFSLRPVDADGRPIANRVEGGKQPRSSMSPTLVFREDSGEFVASLGSPGGAGIIPYTAKALIALLAWELNAQEAIDLPNFANFNGPSVLERGRFPDETIAALEAMGHEVRVEALTSGLQAIQKTETGYFGGADPRREGIVMGDVPE